MKKAGLDIKLELKYYDSLINFFPLSQKDIEELPAITERKLKESLHKKIGGLASIPMLFKLYKRRAGFKDKQLPDEKQIPGRMYSYIAQKV